MVSRSMVRAAVSASKVRTPSLPMISSSSCAAVRQQLAALDAGEQEAVGVAVGHRGLVERLAQLVDGDVADDRDERPRGAGRRVLGDRLQSLAAVPGVAHDAAQDVAFALEHGQRRKNSRSSSSSRLSLTPASISSSTPFRMA